MYAYNACNFLPVSGFMSYRDCVLNSDFEKKNPKRLRSGPRSSNVEPVSQWPESS